MDILHVYAIYKLLLHFTSGTCYRNRIRRHLIVFAAAAPTMALATYFGLSQVTSLYVIIQSMGV